MHPVVVLSRKWTLGENPVIVCQFYRPPAPRQEILRLCISSFLCRGKRALLIFISRLQYPMLENDVSIELHFPQRFSILLSMCGVGVMWQDDQTNPRILTLMAAASVLSGNSGVTVSYLELPTNIVSLLIGRRLRPTGCTSRVVIL